MKIKQLLISFIVLAFILSGCSHKGNNENNQKAFDTFIDNEFKREISSDYLNMHVYLEHPDKYGIDTSKVKVSLGTRPTKESIEKVRKENEKARKAFSAFNRKDLTDIQKDIYDTYKFQSDLDSKMSDSKFDYYEQFFKTMNGIHTALPSLFSDWQLRKEQDAKDLIVLINDILPYVNDALEYTKIQADKGLLISDIDSIISYCKKIADGGMNSAVLSEMNKAIDRLNLGTIKSNDYKNQLKEAFRSSFLKAYTNIINTFNSLKNKNNHRGYASLPNGKEYYALLLQSQMGANDSMSAIKKLLSNGYTESYQKLTKLITQNYNIYSSMTNIRTQFNSYDEILQYNLKRYKEDFPEVNNIEYEIKDINKTIATDGGISAYFNIPALDSKAKKQIRVNPNARDIKKIDTYITVSHEGITGHMYQYAYTYAHNKSHYMKAIANNKGFTEGYAVYCQYYCLKYLDLDQNVLNAYKYNEILSYIAIMQADIGIHYDGWTLDRFKSEMKNYGFSLDDNGAKKQYEQLWANPGAFAPYYLGYLQINQLLKETKNRLKEKFDHKKFIASLIESGAAPFSVIKRHINKIKE